MTRRVIVAGGGMCGLAAAHRLTELAPDLDVVLLEASPRVGGLVGTERTDDGFVIELGADSILTEKPWALALAKRLGLEPELVRTSEKGQGAYVVSRGKLEKIPDGFALLAPTAAWPILRSPVLSWPGKARMALEVLLPRGPVRDDESLESFVTRRFGKELHDRLAQPMVGGIYGADPGVLSMRATIPRFLDAERDSRSVTLGLWKKALSAGKRARASGARYGLFVNFRGGSQTLPDALAALLGDRIRCDVPIERIEPTPGGVKVVTNTRERLDADAIVLALPARAATHLYEPHDADLASDIAAIKHGSSATISFAWRRDEIPHALDAFGFVVPLVENRPILASTWASVKWPHRAPAGMELIRVFVGGAGREHVLEVSDDALVRTCRDELRDLMGITAEPHLVRVARYKDAMPQFEVGHLGRVAEIERKAAQIPRTVLAGAYLRGVGIPDAVRGGEDAAARVVELLGAPGD